jgi:excisionase family DNA binding protein
MSVRLARTVSVDEVAQVLGISRNHAFRCVGRGEIPSVRIGRRVLVPAAFLDRLLSVDDQDLVEDPRRANGPTRRGSPA